MPAKFPSLCLFALLVLIAPELSLATKCKQTYYGAELTCLRQYKTPQEQEKCMKAAQESLLECRLQKARFKNGKTKESLMTDLKEILTKALVAEKDCLKAAVNQSKEQTKPEATPCVNEIRQRYENDVQTKKLEYLSLSKSYSDIDQDVIFAGANFALTNAMLQTYGDKNQAEKLQCANSKVCNGKRKLRATKNRQKLKTQLRIDFNRALDKLCTNILANPEIVSNDMSPQEYYEGGKKGLSMTCQSTLEDINGNPQGPFPRTNYTTKVEAKVAKEAGTYCKRKRPCTCKIDIECGRR